MNPNIRHFLLLLSLFIIKSVNAQIDSLLKALEYSKADTGRIHILNLLTTEYRNIDTAKAFSYAREALELSRELRSVRGFGNTYYRMGGVYRAKRDFDNAITNYNQALLNYRIVGDSKGQMRSYGQLAEVYRQAGKYDNAFENYTKQLDIATKQKDTTYIIDAISGYADIFRYKGDYVSSLANYIKAIDLAEAVGALDDQASLLTNMALVYDYQDNKDAELKAYQRALDINTQLKDSSDLILNNNNIGVFYYDNGRKDKAMEYFNISLALIKKLGDDRAGLKYIAQTYENLAMLAFDTDDYKKARELYGTALEYWLKTKQKKGISMAYGELAEVAIAEKNWKEAEDYLLKDITLTMEIGYKQGEMEANLKLALVMYETGNYKRAYDYQAKYIELNNAMINETRSAQMAEMQTKFETEKKEKELKQQEEELKRKEADDKFKTRILYSLVGVIIVFIALGMFSWRQFTQRKRAFEKLKGQNEEMNRMNGQITEQNLVIDARNKDITDSIHYARRIQSAILPHDDDLKKVLQESFVYYKPKDIISGDIYWLHEEGEMIYFAVIDCTGHGVPGALMSIVAQNALKAAVTSLRRATTADVLSFLSHSIRETFNSSKGEQINDGMDIGICSLNRRHMELGFSGANIPLIIVRNGNVIEYKSDKRLIEGNTTRVEKPFTQNDIKLEKGDMLYLFSDGFSDQFGGEAEKRFSYRELKLLFAKIGSKDPEAQMTILDKAFMGWKGDLDQIDDVLIVGVRI